jgi:acetyl esterase
MCAVSELRIGRIPARLYRPVGGRTPLVVYTHGGGWTIGSLEAHDRVCRRLADGSGTPAAAPDRQIGGRTVTAGVVAATSG